MSVGVDLRRAKGEDHIRVAAPRGTPWCRDSCRHRTLGHNSQREFVIARAATVVPN